MKRKFIITAGSSYIDIDAYAGCIAYAELLELMGQDAYVVSSANLNASIPESVFPRNNKVLKPNSILLTNAEFIILDVSNKDYFEDFVVFDNIVEIIDHHTGCENDWVNNKNINLQIEYIGSVCTLIYEKWIKNGLISHISRGTAQLLIAGILDNTLNFMADVTTDRDREAYVNLLKYANVSDQWYKTYFIECQKDIEAEFDNALINDLKRIDNVEKLPNIMGQMCLWDATKIIENNYDAILDILNQYEQDWLVNIICLKENKSYFIGKNKKVIDALSDFINLRITDNVGIADKALLRKEILKLTMV